MDKSATVTAALKRFSDSEERALGKMKESCTLYLRCPYCFTMQAELPSHLKRVKRCFTMLPPLEGASVADVVKSVVKEQRFKKRMAVNC